MTAKKKTPKKVRLKRDIELQPEVVNSNELGWFEMSRRGAFRIVVKDDDGKLQRSFPTFYEGVASLKVDGVQYTAVSEYFAGTLPHNIVLRVSEKP